MRKFLTVIAAFSWAWTNILIRMISRTETTLSLMVASNALFVVACGIMLPFVWVTPTLFDFGMMVLMGIGGTLSHLCLVYAFAMAKASRTAGAMSLAFDTR